MTSGTSLRLHTTGTDRQMIFDILVWTRTSRSGASVTPFRINTVTRSPRFVFEAFLALQFFRCDGSFSIRPKDARRKSEYIICTLSLRVLDISTCETRKNFRIFVFSISWQELCLWHRLIYLGMFDEFRWISRLRSPLEETGIFWVSWKSYLFR